MGCFCAYFCIVTIIQRGHVQMMRDYLVLLMMSCAGFLLGSVLFAYLIPKVVCHMDITKVSADGNPGTSNVCRYCGKKIGILTGILEYGKGFFPVAIGYALIDREAVGGWLGILVAAPVLGHMFSVFHRGRGGIGIAPMCGTLIASFLFTKLALYVVVLYAIAKFGLKFKYQCERTRFVFLSFLIGIQFLEKNMVYRLTYGILSALVLSKTAVRKAQGHVLAL